MSSNDTTPVRRHAVTIEEPLMRSISIADIRRYMEKKGFRLGKRPVDASLKGCELWILAPPPFRPEVPAVDIFDEHDDPGALRFIVGQVARCLDRPASDVLREIAGEPVTLEDANAAVQAVMDASRPKIGGYPFNLATVEPAAALRYAGDLHSHAMAMIGHGRHVAEYTAIARAVEDLAVIAVDLLRRGRGAPGGATS